MHSLLQQNPAGPAAELVAEPAGLVAELAGLAVALLEPVAGLASPVALLARPLRRIPRPQIGFPGQILEPPHRSPGSPVGFRLIPALVDLLPEGIVEPLEPAIIVAECVNLCVCGVCTNFVRMCFTGTPARIIII